MAFTEEVSLIGIYEIGEWTAVDDGGQPTNVHSETNVYTETPWGRPARPGGRIIPNVQRLNHEAGDSPGVLDSIISSFAAQLEISLAAGHLENIRRMMGLPASALTGDLSATTPTAEHLVVRADELGTEELQLYVRSMGPLGPRTTYFPRCRVANPSEVNLNRDNWLEPTATFDLYENANREFYWHIDAAA